MISLSDAAKAELENFFKVQDKAPVRVCVQEDEGGRRFLGMLLEEDDPADDQVFEVEGYRFLVDNDLAGALEAIQIDVVDGDFVIRFKARADGQAGCGCGCGCGCGDSAENCGDACGCAGSEGCGCGHAH